MFSEVNTLRPNLTVNILRQGKVFFLKPNLLRMSQRRIYNLNFKNKFDILDFQSIIFRDFIALSDPRNLARKQQARDERTKNRLSVYPKQFGDVFPLPLAAYLFSPFPTFSVRLHSSQCNPLGRPCRARLPNYRLSPDYWFPDQYRHDATSMSETLGRILGHARKYSFRKAERRFRDAVGVFCC